MWTVDLYHNYDTHEQTYWYHAFTYIPDQHWYYITFLCPWLFFRCFVFSFFVLCSARHTCIHIISRPWLGNILYGIYSKRWRLISYHTWPTTAESGHLLIIYIWSWVSVQGSLKQIFCKSLKIINQLASLIHIYFQVCLLVQQEEISEAMAPKDISLVI